MIPSVLSWHIAALCPRSHLKSERPARLGRYKQERSKGLAICRIEKRRRIAHEREPLDRPARRSTDKVRVLQADLSGSPSPDAELELKPAFSFAAESREGSPSELTSLEYSPDLGGSLVVTASEDDQGAFHGNTLWFVPDGESSQPRKVATFEVAMKAEGLAILGVEKTAERTALKLVITYDNDPHATKIPSRVQTVTLVRDNSSRLRG